MNIILGKAKTGKSLHIYQCIEQNIKDGEEAILFVPSQSRAKTENEYMNLLQKNGIIGVNITTISEYVSQELKFQSLHLEENYISKMDQKILLTQVIAENEDIFEVFDKVKSYAGFLDMMSIYMDLLRKECIKIEEFEKLQIEDKLLDCKLKEIVRVYKKYMEKREKRFMDSIDEMDLFLERILPNLHQKRMHIYFDGYNNFTINEYRLIEGMLKKGLDVTISLTTDITCFEDLYSGISESIFEVSNQTYKMLLEIANRTLTSVENIIKYENYSNANPALIRLADQVFSSGKKLKKEHVEAIHLHIETNTIKEIEKVAKKINALIQKGYRYQDICIYTTDIDMYQRLLQKICYEYQIPLYVNKSNGIEKSLLVKYLLGIFEIIVNGMTTTNILEVLKLGLTYIEKKDIDLLENYIYEFHVPLYAFSYPFKMNNIQGKGYVYDVENLNEIRRKIVALFGNLLKSDEKVFVHDFIEKIYLHMSENEIFNRYQQIMAQFETEAPDFETRQFEGQVWEKICEIFDSMVKIYGEQKVDVEELIHVFKIILKDCQIKTIPATLDQVELADINVSRIGMKKIVFFVGVNEGIFPKKVEQDLCFNDLELEKLKEIGISIKETSLSKFNMGLYNIYEALNNVEEELYISIPAADLNGRATRMSSLVTMIKDIIANPITGSVTSKEKEFALESIYSMDDLFERFVQRIKEIDNFSDVSQEEKILLLALQEYFRNHPNYNEIMKYQKRDENLKKETLDKIYGKELKTSVSRLELFQKCPFSYYMQYTLNIKPRKEAKASYMDIGSFMHAVLESFSLYLFEHHIQWQEIITLDNVLEEKYEKVLYQIIQKELEKNLKKQKESIRYGILKQKLIHTMKKVMLVIANSFNQSDFIPYGYEIEFKEDGIVAPIIVEISNGKRIFLNGKIDRIDVFDQEDKRYVRVVDYKSSGKTLELDKIKEGISLQLITYLIVFMENQKKEKHAKRVIPAGMLYFNLSDRLIGLSEYTENNIEIEKKITEALRMKGIFLKDAKVLEKMDHKLQDPVLRMIDVSPRTLNGKSKKVLEEEEFENLCKIVKELLKNIGEEMIQGVVKIEPNKKEEYCQYCNYASVCRKDSCL